MKNNIQSITIGITAFNEGKLLLESWSSILEQTNQDWNAVIVLDGGGDKKTKSFFDSIEHPRLKKYSYKSNQGIYPCRTKAIELSNTEWYFHLDADDILPSSSIELIVNKINKEKEIEFLAGTCKCFNMGPDKILYPQKDPNILCNKPLFLPQSPIKKDLFYKMGGFDLSIQPYAPWCDWDFWLSVYEQNIVGAELNEIIYFYRRRNNSVTSKKFNTIDKALEKIINRHPIFFNSTKRKKLARSNNFEIMARFYRSIGKRKLAKKYADYAIAQGNKKKILETIAQEFSMSFLRYKIRRIGRYLSYFSIF